MAMMLSLDCTLEFFAKRAKYRQESHLDSGDRLAQWLSDGGLEPLQGPLGKASQARCMAFPKNASSLTTAIGRTLSTIW